MGFLVQLGILLVSTALQHLLRPRVKRTDAPDLEFPRAEQGLPIPIVYGTQAVAPIITAVGRIAKVEGPDGVTFYESVVTGDLCLGPIDAIVDIQFGGKSLRLHPVSREDSTSESEARHAITVVGAPTQPGLPYIFAGDAPVTFDVNARQLFGGQRSEGGVERNLTVHRGTLTDAVDPVTQELWEAGDLPGTGSGYPGSCYVVFGSAGLRFYWGTVPQPKPPVVIVKLIPNALGLGAIGNDANPAEIIWDLLTHPVRGRGVDPARIDLASFLVAGQQLTSEGLGLSCTFSRQQELQDQIEDIGRHIHGDCYQSALTGLWTMVLARDDYDPDTLPEVTRATARELRVDRPSWRPTTNEITVAYRRYDDTPLQGASVTGEVLTNALRFLPPFNAGFYQCEGRNLSSVSVYNETQDVALVEGDDYEVNVRSGVFFVRDTANTSAGDVLLVSYTNGTAVVGYREETELAQDLANQQATRDVRPETIERPFLTTAISASVHAWRELRLRTRPLAEASWTASPEDFDITPGAVRAVSWTPAVDQPGDFVLTRVPFRVLKVDYRALEEGGPRVTAVEDAFGVSVAPTPGDEVGGGASTRPPAPAMAIGCGIGGAGVSRIALFAGDTLYDIEVWEADDEAGTGAVLVATVAGSTLVYDGTVGKYYRARQVQPAGLADPGPYTPWITCAAVDEDPEDPVCVPPVITATSSRSEDGLTGTVTLSVYDPQHRHSLIEARVRTGGAAFSGWTPYDPVEEPGDTSSYEIEVALTEGIDATVEWRVTYVNCIGDTVRAEGVQFFPASTDPEVPPPDNSGADPSPIEIVIFGATETKRWSELPAEVQEITGTGSNQTHFPLQSFVRARIVAVAESSSLPVGARTAVQFQNPTTREWHFLDLVEGPFYPLDPDSIGSDINLAKPGEYILIAVEAKMDVRLRGVTLGCDGSVDKVLIGPRIVLQLVPGLPDPVGEPEPPVPVPPDPGSCDIANPVDMDTGWTGGDAPGAVWTNMSNTTARITIEGSGSGPNYWEITLTGLTPSKQHTFYLTGQTEALPVGAFLEVVGGDLSEVDEENTPQTLIARGDSNSGGEITLRYGVQELEGSGGGGGGSGSDDLSYLNQAAASAAGWVESGTGTVLYDTGVEVGGFPTSLKISAGGATPKRLARTLNLVPGAGYVFRVWADTQGQGPWWSEVSLGATSGGNSAQDQINGAEPEQQLQTGTLIVDGTGEVEVFFSARQFFGDAVAWLAGLTWKQVSGPVADETVVDFSNLGYCEGTGLPEDPDPNDPSGPPPPPPPAGPWPPPPTGGARPFGIHNIDYRGYAYWNQTVIGLTPRNTENILLQCEAADTYVMALFGPQSRWKDGSGRYRADLHIDVIEEMYADVNARNTLNQAATATGPFTKRRLFLHYVLDEPNRADERYGGSIPFADIERVAIKSKERFPLLPTLVRVNPTNNWYARKMVGLDHLWAEYHKKRGDVTAYRNTELQAAADYGQGLVVGLHYKHYEGPGGVGPRYITPAELRQDGRILASNVGGLKSIAFSGWRFDLALVAQPGFMDELQGLRDYYAGLD